MEFNIQKNNSRLFLFLLSFSLFIYQILLTRFFSIIFSYHMVFVVTSVAVLGMSMGSIMVYKLYNRLNKEYIFITGAIALTISYMSVIIILYSGVTANGLIINTIIVAVPFIIAGFVFGTVYRLLSADIGGLYLSDLVGAGIGLLSSLFFLEFLGIYRTTIIMVTIPMLVITKEAFVKKKLVIRSIGSLIILILVSLNFLPNTIISQIEKDFGGFYKSNQSIYQKAKNGNMTPNVLFTSWNGFSRTDVIEIEENSEEMYITIDAGASAPMYRFDGTEEDLIKYRKETGYMPFSFGDVSKSLLIGVGGGRDALYALAGGSKDIIALDINASTIDAVKEFGYYNGNLYDRDEITTVVDDGRGYVEENDEVYDLIYLSLVMTNASQGGTYALSEDYIYTVEAFDSYLDHLEENGKIGFLVHDQDDMAKIIGMAIKTYENRGITVEQALDYIAVISDITKMGENNFHLSQPVIVLSKSPYDEKALESMNEFVISNNFAAIHIPGIVETTPLKDLRDGSLSLDEYINHFPKNISPSTDDKPFFYNFEAGAPQLLRTLLAGLIVVWLLVFFKHLLNKKLRKPILFFSVIGMAFMIIEVSSIQRYVLFLGHPMYAISIVLSSLLIGSGIGSLISRSHLLFKRSSVRRISLLIVSTGITGLLMYDYYLSAHIEWPIISKAIVVFLIIFIQGFFMGMLFPKGVSMISNLNRQEEIPLYIGVNGIMSVMGSVVAVVLAMTIGFELTLVIGITMYGSLMFMSDFS